MLYFEKQVMFSYLCVGCFFSTIRIGHTGMPTEHIVENVVAVAERLSQKLPEVRSRRCLAVRPSHQRSKTRMGDVALLCFRSGRAWSSCSWRLSGQCPCLSSRPLSAVRAKPRDSAHETCWKRLVEVHILDRLHHVCKHSSRRESRGSEEPTREVERKRKPKI